MYESSVGYFARCWCCIIHISLQIYFELMKRYTVYPKKYAHGFCFAVLCRGYTLTYFLISIRLTSLALWQSNDCPSASKATLMNMDEYFMWIHYERLHSHNKAKHNKTVCIFLGIYCRIEKRHLFGLAWPGFQHRQGSQEPHFQQNERPFRIHWVEKGTTHRIHSYHKHGFNPLDASA